MKRAGAKTSRRHITIRDVARAVGVSVSTVSATLNGTDYVSQGMRARILKAVARLHYRPNDLARSLRMQRSHTLAVVVPDLSNCFYTEMLRGMEDQAAALGYTLLIGDSRDSWSEERKYLDAFSRRRVDGVIRIPAMDSATGQARSLLRNIPVVYADRVPPFGDPRVGSVSVDNVGAAYGATAFLLELGHRRIAVITGALTTRNAADRVLGYRRAMRSQGALFRQDHVRVTDFEMASGAREAAALLASPEPPTAIFCTNNTLALGALEAIQRLGLRCPEEISLIGFDDSFWSTMVRPCLTAVRQPARDIGMGAARVLIDYIEQRRRMPADQILPTRLVVRDSCAPPPGLPVKKSTSRRAAAAANGARRSKEQSR
jgi:LacI family transcriptional regulator